MKTVSLCMIVKNEAAVLARCLASVGEFADEIVLVDTGSTDETVRIGEQFGAKILRVPWEDDFAKARNRAFEAGRMEYLFWLDADDVLPSESLKRLMAFKNGTDAPNTVVLPYYLGVDDAGNPAMTYDRERIFKRSCDPRWHGAVHEAIVMIPPILRIQAPVVHRREKPGDPMRNLRIYEGMRAQGKPFSPRDWYYYARELRTHRRYDEALRCYAYFLSLPDGWIENRISAWQEKALCEDALGDWPAAVQSHAMALALGGKRAELCCSLGGLWMKIKRWELAVQCYETALTCVPDVTRGGFIQTDCYGFLPHIQLCVCYDKMGRQDLALFHHREALALKPEDPACLQNEAYFSESEQKKKAPQ